MASEKPGGEGGALDRRHRSGLARPYLVHGAGLPSDAHILSACQHQLGVMLAQVAMTDTTNEAGAVGAVQVLMLYVRAVT